MIGASCFGTPHAPPCRISGSRHGDLIARRRKAVHQYRFEFLPIHYTEALNPGRSVGTEPLGGPHPLPPGRRA